MAQTSATARFVIAGSLEQTGILEIFACLIGKISEQSVKLCSFYLQK